MECKATKPTLKEDAAAAKPEIIVATKAVIAVITANVMLAAYMHLEGVLTICVPRIPVMIVNIPHQIPCELIVKLMLATRVI